MTEDSDSKQWRTIIIRTDGLEWAIDPDNSNTSMLEIKEICREILEKFNVDRSR
jgi:hypothetical protein